MPLNMIQVILETILSANHLTGAKIQSSEPVIWTGNGLGHSWQGLQTHRSFISDGHVTWAVIVQQSRNYSLSVDT